MKASQLPTKFQIPFANNAASGTSRPIPVASQASVTPGAASLYDGFPTVTGQPLASGGIPPAMQDFNGLFNQITAWLQWQNAGGLVPFDQTFCTAIGGYPASAILASTTLGKVWLSTVDGNTTNPDSASSAGWIGLTPSAAKTPFNYQPFTSTVRTNATGNQSGVMTQVLSGLSFKKISSTSNVVISANFTTFSPSTTGGAGAVTFRLILGGSYYDEAGLNNMFVSSNGTVTGGGTNTPTFLITGAPSGTLAITATMRRDDNQSWNTIFNPNSSDSTGLPVTPLSKFFAYEVEPGT